VEEGNEKDHNEMFYAITSYDMVMYIQIFIADIKQIDKGEKVGIYNVVVRLRDNM